MEYYTQKDVLKLAEYEIVKLGGKQKSLAAICDLSPAYLSDILAGKRDPSPKLLVYLGLKAEKVYFPAGESDEHNV